MNIKYYTIALDMNTEGKTKEQLLCLKFLRSKLRQFSSRNLLLKHGEIRCQNVFYNVFFNMPIIVRQNDGGTFDQITDIRVDIVSPFIKCRELSIEEVMDFCNNVKYDVHANLFKYELASKELVGIIQEYMVFRDEIYKSTISSGIETIRKRKNKN